MFAKVPIPNKFRDQKVLPYVAEEGKLHRLVAAIYLTILTGTAVLIIISQQTTVVTESKTILSRVGAMEGYECTATGDISSKIGVPDECKAGKPQPTGLKALTMDCGPTALHDQLIIGGARKTEDKPFWSPHNYTSVLFMQMRYQNAWFQDSKSCENWVSSIVAPAVVRQSIATDSIFVSGGPGGGTLAIPCERSPNRIPVWSENKQRAADVNFDIITCDSRSPMLQPAWRDGVIPFAPKPNLQNLTHVCPLEEKVVCMGTAAGSPQTMYSKLFPYHFELPNGNGQASLELVQADIDGFCAHSGSMGLVCSTSNLSTRAVTTAPGIGYYFRTDVEDASSCKFWDSKGVGPDYMCSPSGDPSTLFSWESAKGKKLMQDGVKQIVNSAATFCKPFDDVHALPPYQCVQTSTKEVTTSLYSRMANAFAYAQTALAVLLTLGPVLARTCFAPPGSHGDANDHGSLQEKLVSGGPLST